MLIQNRDKKYDEILSKAIEQLEKEGYEEIKADMEGYEAPSQMIRKKDDQPFAPDITAKRGNKKHYFEISRKTGDEEVTQLVSKWKMLQLISEMKDAAFKLFIPHGSMKFTQELKDKYGLKADLVKI